MSIFLTNKEKQLIRDHRGQLSLGRFVCALRRRAEQRSRSPGLLGMHADATWWYPAAEYVCECAMAYALEPDERLASWLRDVTLVIVRRPVGDWVGPWYRDHVTNPPVGHLETAHLCWAVGAACDLSADVFGSGELDEVHGELRSKGMTLCRRWLERNTHLANWRAVMTSGIAVAGAVLRDREAVEDAVREAAVCVQAFQPDGSYAESLQYGNYLALALTMIYEAVIRTDPKLAAQIDITAYARGIPWITSSMLYMKPMSGWGEEPRPRAVNFNDCAACFRPSGDVLLNVAARCRESLPREAGLARWLFDWTYGSVPAQGPDNLATFGLRNNWGFLTVPLLAQSPAPLSPEDAGLPPAAGFSNGHVLVRDQWQGKTVLAINGGGEPLCGPGHLHGDLNSFILVHNQQRLLVDPGHSCYRNLIHGLESSTQTHSTCSFLISQDALGLQEDLAKASLLEQSNVPSRRQIVGGKVSDPVAPRGRRLLLMCCGEVTAVGSDAGSLYGEPIREFSRFWLHGGPHVLFVVDRIQASQPVKTLWSWLLNNRDGNSDIEVGTSNEIVLRRQTAGLKMFHTSDGQLNGPVYAYVHDAYHPEPDRPGEGRPGSGMLYRWIEPSAREFRLAVHAFAIDDYGLVDDWSMKVDGDIYTLERTDACWSLKVVSSTPLELILQCVNDGRCWQLIEQDGNFSFTATKGHA